MPEDSSNVLFYKKKMSNNNRTNTITRKIKINSQMEKTGSVYGMHLNLFA